jgi:hypothetical protein
MKLFLDRTTQSVAVRLFLLAVLLVLSSCASDSDARYHVNEGVPLSTIKRPNYINMDDRDEHDLKEGISKSIVKKGLDQGGKLLKLRDIGPYEEWLYYAPSGKKYRLLFQGDMLLRVRKEQ